MHIASLGLIMFITCALAVPQATVPGQDNAPSAKELLRLCAQANAWEAKSQVTLEIKAQTIYDQEMGPPQVLRSETTLVRSRSGNLYSVHAKGTSFQGAPGAEPRATPLVMLQISDGKTAYWYIAQRVQIARTPEDVERYRQVTLHVPRNGSFLFGAFFAGEAKPQSTSIFKLLEGAGMLEVSGREKIEGHDCFVLSGLTKSGWLRVWIAPELDHNFVRFELKQEKPGATFHSFQAEFGSPVFKKVGNRTLLVGGRFKSVAQPLQGRKYSETVEAQVTEFELEPMFDEKLFAELNIPEETEVIFADAPSERGRWRHGKPGPVE